VDGCGDEMDQLIVVGLTALRKPLGERERTLEPDFSIAIPYTTHRHAPLTPTNDAFRHDLDFLALNLLPVGPLLLGPWHPDPPSQEHLSQNGDRADLTFGLMARGDMDGETERRNDRVVVHVARLRVYDHGRLVQVDRHGASFSSTAPYELSGTHRGRGMRPGSRYGLTFKTRGKMMASNDFYTARETRGGVGEACEVPGVTGPGYLRSSTRGMPGVPPRGIGCTSTWPCAYAYVYGTWGLLAYSLYALHVFVNSSSPAVHDTIGARLIDSICPQGAGHMSRGSEDVAGFAACLG
jgi:hypothetical protein